MWFLIKTNHFYGGSSRVLLIQSIEQGVERLLWDLMKICEEHLSVARDKQYGYYIIFLLAYLF